jgi:D-alanyl-D-alanine carboxypeptidase
VILVLGVALVAAPVTVWFASRGDVLVRPADPCTQPPPLVSFQGVTLQPNAMTAFKHAETIAGRPIPVVQSYRSCAQQAEACKQICGNVNGCPGRCVKPGFSYHQLGAAIDVSADTLAQHDLVSALERAGWCESVPATDPGHFSFDGCH